MKKGIIVLISLVAMACSHTPDSGVIEAEPVGSDGSVSLTLAKTGIASIQYGTITRRRLSNDIRAKGKLILSPKDNAQVTSFAEGTVRSILVKEGDHVKAGQPLVTLTSPEIIRLQQDFLNARIKRTLLQSEYKRQQQLGEEKINAAKRLEEAAANLSEAETLYRSLYLQLKLFNISPDELDSTGIRANIDVVSPIDGIVEQVGISLGQYIPSDFPLFRVINKQNLLIELRVFEKDVPFIRVDQRVTFSLANLGNESYEATIKSIGATVEENARTVKVLAVFRNSSSFILPGMFVTAEIHTDEKKVDALPEEAVMNEGDSSTYLFYSLSSPEDSLQIFYRLPVQSGFAEEGYKQVILLDSLPAGARIVVRGGYYIKSEEEDQPE